MGRLCSAETPSLVRPQTAKLIGDRGFSVAQYGIIYQFKLDKQDRSLLLLFI